MDEKFVHIKENRYRVLKINYLKGSLVYEGDIIRVDEVSLEKLKKVLKIIPFHPKKIIYFRYGVLKNWDINRLGQLGYD
jgi:hypothetical protein